MGRIVRRYWREVLKNLLISIVLFILLIEAMVIFDMPIVYNAVFVISILASITGVAYVLTIRNPQNYLGFVLGIISSALLGVQFLLLKSYDLTVLYYVVFIPFQALSIYTWFKAGTEDKPTLSPAYLTAKERVYAGLVFVGLVLLDYVLVTFWLDPQASQLMRWVNGILIGSSVLANFLLIWKKIDSWFLWILYSLDGLFLAILIGNQFNMLLFSFFLIINGITTVSWIRNHRFEQRLQ